MDRTQEEEEEEEEGGEETTMTDAMDEEVKTMRDGMEADILQINVVLHELLQRLESFVSLLHKQEDKHTSGISIASSLHIKEKMHPSHLELQALQRTLFMLQDFVDVETSLEKRVIDHLELGKLGGIIFKDDQVTVAAETSAAMPTWLRAIRVALNDTILAIERIYAQVSLSQAQGLSYFLDGYNDAHTRILSCISPHTRQLANLISQRKPLEPQRIETPQLAESSSSSSSNDDVYGREEDKRKVIESLVSDLGKSTTSSSSSSSSCSEDIIHVMSIVGGPGVGKTTLAKLVYNDERIDNCFDMKMWVSMSNCYSDIMRTTKSFVEAATMVVVGETTVSEAPREETSELEEVVAVLEEATVSEAPREETSELEEVVPVVEKATVSEAPREETSELEEVVPVVEEATVSEAPKEETSELEEVVAVLEEATVCEAPREETSELEEVVSVVGEASDTSSSALAIVPSKGEGTVSDSNLALATVPGISSSVLVALQRLLKKLLLGKKFFLVLDGVSNEICCDWEVLRVPFRVGATNDSRILITSRSSMVSSRLGTISSYTLGPLLYDDCWSLMRNLTFGKNIGTATSTPCPPSLELSQHIEKIAEHLQGFPSLAVALGTFLHSIPHEDKLQMAGKMILSSDASAPPLSISSTMLWAYHSLSSPQLKQCFVFCGLFRKRYRFKKSRLIKLWMAEGFLQTKKESDLRMEDLGVSYLEELMERSLFQHPRDSPYFMLPEAVHDLAQYIFNNRALKMYTDSISKSFRSDHHSTLCSVINSQGQGHHKYRFYNTFLSMEECQTCMNHIPRDLFQNLVGLRVLDLSNCRLTQLPDSIRYLEHLRFLDLSRNRIEYLPECISMLHFLQTLKIKSIYHILEFPKDMERLLNMRHLYLGLGYRSFPMPVGIGKLTNLQSLRAFSVGTERDEFGRIEELRELRYLRGSLTILNLENVEKECNGGWLLDKDLQKLQLKWNHMEDNEIAENLLASLQPHPTLKHLTIISYGGLRFPTWIGNPTFSNLKTIELKRCNRCEFLPPLGLLPLLDSLQLYKMNALKCIDGGFCDNENEKFRKLKIFLGLKRNTRFPKLKVLELKKLYGLEKWTGLLEGDMPLLEELSIINCDMLISLPNLKILGSLRELKFVNIKKLQMLPKEGLPSSLEELDIEGCPLLHKSCRTAGNEDWSKVKAVPHVTIGGRDF